MAHVRAGHTPFRSFRESLAGRSCYSRIANKIVDLSSGGESNPPAHHYNRVIRQKPARNLMVFVLAWPKLAYSAATFTRWARTRKPRGSRGFAPPYAICAVVTALSSIFLAMYTRAILPSSHGNVYELYAIAAAVPGGFSLRGGEELGHRGRA